MISPGYIAVVILFILYYLIVLFVEKKILNEPKEIIINEDVWLGLKSTITKGVTIGKGSVIGAHSLINKDVPPGVIMGSPRAKIVKENILYSYDSNK